jgi:NADP-dependent 3-hydroxy acid dehydrogenase YdfG
MRYRNKAALITAAANGVGRATFDIIAVDNHQERLDAAADALTKAGGRAHSRLCDALDQSRVDAVMPLLTG